MTNKEIVEKIAGMLRVERSCGYDMTIPAAQHRSQWIEENVPAWKRITLFERAKTIIKESETPQ